jgi:hypothetical protein
MELSRETIGSSDQCPTDPEWKAYAVGRVEQQALQLMSSHLLACQQCLEVLDRISSKESRSHPNEPRSPFLLEENCLRLNKIDLDLAKLNGDLAEIKKRLERS